ncbi:MAG: choice-of-anchor J domain-containing protein [Saprospiraceae bacterium]
MKRILTLLLLSGLFYQTHAQVLFSQDFESGTLDPMTAVDVDGVPVNPSAPTFCGPTWTVVGNAKNKLVVSTSWLNPVGIADDWLISPAIPVTEANTFLFWEAYSPDANYRDGYEVRISTTDNQIASFTTLALNIPAEVTTTQKRALKLDAYIGQTIYFAFRNHSNDKYLLYMDNISVRVLPTVDVGFKGLTFEKYNPIGTQVTFKATIENNGATPLTSVNYTWTVGSEIYTDSITGLNIATRGTKELTHTVQYSLNDVGEFPITVNIDSPNGMDDPNPYDNVGQRNLYGLNEVLPKKVLVEEGTGTWCGWCPRGFVTMEIVGADYSDVAIPVAIHNYDPMLVPDYDTPFSNSISGYPSGHIDRKELGVDPNDPSTGTGFIPSIGHLQNRMVPVQVNVETTYDEATRTATIHGTAHSSVATQSNTLRFSCIITEDHVVGGHSATQLQNYDQVNYYAANANGVMGGFENLPNPVPASQMIYNFVARAIIGGFFGTENSISPVLAANEDFSFDYSYVVPAGSNPELMKAIVVIMDDETGEVLNSEAVQLAELTSVPLVPQGKTALYPNPATDQMTLSVDFQTEDQIGMKIYDTYGRLIQNLGPLDLTNGTKTQKINVADLPTGEYLLELRHKNSVTALPFTKI